ncbi:MAG: hypothetical protein GXO34_02490 [Deltaproteobacteria bacterium]|nr:hypothetical protein [Deltaproteobacteria bacterium]
MDIENPDAVVNDSVLETFGRLEEKALQLARRYGEVVEERELLRRELAAKTAKVSELEARIRQLEGAFSTVDGRVASLLRQIDECLDESGRESKSEQVLPGMNGS